MEKHIRELSDFLRGYGATDVEIKSGGKHNKLEFIFRDKSCSFRVPRTSSFDPRTILNIKTRLKRTLGSPIVEEKSHRTLEEMMSDLNESVSAKTVDTTLASTSTSPSETTWKVRMACYKNTPTSVTNQVHIKFPIDFKGQFSSFFGIERLDDEHWRLTPGGSYTFKDDSAKTILVRYHEDGITPFSVTEGEAVKANNEILIYIPMGIRKQFPQPPQLPKLPQITRITHNAGTVVQSSPPSPKVQAPRVHRVSTQPTPAAHPVPPWISNDATLEDQMRSIIQRVREIETLCPYRLVRLESGRIVWRAPTIE